MNSEEWAAVRKLQRAAARELDRDYGPGHLNAFLLAYAGAMLTDKQRDELTAAGWRHLDEERQWKAEQSEQAERAVK